MTILNKFSSTHKCQKWDKTILCFRNHTYEKMILIFFFKQTPVCTAVFWENF
ncbi:hypothetical protein QTP88_014265 [Uroleucon formosanum]